MGPNLRAEGLAAARLALQRALLGAKVPLPALTVQEAITRAVLKAYIPFASDPATAKNRHRLTPQTEALLKLEVGQVLRAPLETSATWCSRMATVRRRTGNKAWRATIDLRDGESIITRIADGASTLRPSYGAQSRALAAMKPWQVISWPGDRLETGTKNTARHLLGEPLADWKREKTNKGLRITRIR